MTSPSHGEKTSVVSRYEGEGEWKEGTKGRHQQRGGT